MAEVEFGGMTFKGGKMMVLLTALSTLGGASWGAFEFYKDYMDMKEIVQNIDVGEIEARNNVIETKLEEAIDYTRDIKNSLKDDIIRIERITESTSNRMKDVQDDIDQRLREVSDLSRETEKDVRDSLRDLEDRVDVKMEKLDEELRDTLQKALDNPLSD
jgi:predicted  nucleic acid-binding Zn-ribbon protein